MLAANGQIVEAMGTDTTPQCALGRSHFTSQLTSTQHGLTSNTRLGHNESCPSPGPSPTRIHRRRGEFPISRSAFLRGRGSGGGAIFSTQYALCLRESRGAAVPQ